MWERDSLGNWQSVFSTDTVNVDGVQTCIADILGKTLDHADDDAVDETFVGLDFQVCGGFVMIFLKIQNKLVKMVRSEDA